MQGSGGIFDETQVCPSLFGASAHQLREPRPVGARNPVVACQAAFRYSLTRLPLCVAGTIRSCCPLGFGGGVGAGGRWSAVLSAQDCELVAQHDDLKILRAARTHSEASQPNQQAVDNAAHEDSASAPIAAGRQPRPSFRHPHASTSNSAPVPASEAEHATSKNTRGHTHGSGTGAVATRGHASCKFSRPTPEPPTPRSLRRCRPAPTMSHR